MQTTRQRRVARVAVWVAVLGLVFGVLSSIIMATGADAHTALKSVSPKDGSTVSTAPTQVVLTFSEAVSKSFATVSVTGPSGESGEGKAVVDGAVVTQLLRAGLPNGRYTVAFRVVSEDGHPVSDRTTFGVAAAATPSTTVTASVPAPTTTTATAPPSTAAAAPPAEAESDGRALRLGLAVGVGAFAVAAGVALIAATRRRGAAWPTE